MGFMGMNMAQNMGGMNANNLFQMGQPQNMQGQTQPQNNMGQMNGQPAQGGMPNWFCPNCGNKNEGNFCVNCGTKRPG